MKENLVVKIRSILLNNIGKHVAVADGDGNFWLDPIKITPHNIDHLTAEIAEILASEDAAWFAISMFIAPDENSLVSPTGHINRDKAVQVL